jgi:hypothetical protein
MLEVQPHQQGGLPMVTVADLAERLQRVLVTTADDAGRSTGCIQRQRKFTGATLCQTLVLGWFAHPAASVADLCRMASVCGVSVTPRGMRKRFTDKTVELLQTVFAAAVTQIIATDPVAIPLLRRFPGGVYIQDCSQLTLPAVFADAWPGCGDSTEDGHTAVLKLGARLELARGQLAGPVLVPGRVHDRVALAQLPALPPQSLRIADLGFFSTGELAERDAEGQWWLTRLQSGTTVVWEGKAWTCSALLATQGPGVIDLTVEVGAAQHLPARLLAFPVPEQVANARRRRMRAEARRRGQAISEERLRLAAWTVLITNVPHELLSPLESLVLLRIRWQIELLFKCWKSAGAQIDQWGTTEPMRLQCALYAKLIAVVLQHWFLLAGCWQVPARSLIKAAAQIRERVILIAASRMRLPQLTEAIELVIADLASLQVQRRRTNPSAFQLLADPHLMEDRLVAT